MPVACPESPLRSRVCIWQRAGLGASRTPGWSWGWGAWLPHCGVFARRLLFSSRPLCCAFLPLASRASLMAAAVVIWCSWGLEEESQEQNPSLLGVPGLRAALGQTGTEERTVFYITALFSNRTRNIDPSLVLAQWTRNRLLMFPTAGMEAVGLLWVLRSLVQVSVGMDGQSGVENSFHSALSSVRVPKCCY